MTSAERHERLLLDLTALPTAAGREAVVIAWVRRWAKRRPWVGLRVDRYGNLMLGRKGARSASPLVFAAHLDHPAFVVEGARGRHVVARFLGGVRESYFPGSRVRLWRGAARGPRGVVVGYEALGGRDDPRVTVLFARPTRAEPGEVMTWDLGPAAVRGGRVYAPACDDLAGVAAALAAFERWGGARRRVGDLRVLLTRAEEVGFIGAIAACGSGVLPRRSRIVALENSKSFADSPLGGGPIVRVGDRTSTFDPDLTYRVAQAAAAIQREDASFLWQRKLMPGGTCEASAYQALGFTATCVCLPLGRYHNMNEDTGRVDREVIALADFHGLVRLLTALPAALGAGSPRGSGLRPTLDALFARRVAMLR